MKLERNTSEQKLSLYLLLVILCIGPIQSVFSNIEVRLNPIEYVEGTNVVLSSNGFNAKKRSSFTVAGRTEHIERGLTIIHFNSTDTYEFRTYDTYSSQEACAELIKVLEELQKNNATFAILAHDSAANGFLQNSETLKKLGFIRLSALKNRQAYVMHNFEGSIYESVDDTSYSATEEVPEGILDKKIYFPKIQYDFEPNIDRYIAHAGGEINGVKSTNSKEALDLNYKKGFRLFELDIIETSDGKLVAAHDWEMWARFTDYTGELPPSHSEFMKHKIYGDYTTLDMAGINSWFKSHPDATLVTDKVNDPIGFADSFVDKNRLIMELFSQMAIEEASKNGIRTMISQGPLLKIGGDKLDYLAINNVKYVAVSRRIIASKKKLMLQLNEAGVRVYVYNVNFDPGKDEKYVQENEIGLVYGMYADKWVFDQKDTEVAK